MVLREQDKHFIASLYIALGVVFTWKGLWDGFYEIPYIASPWVFLFLGFAMLTISGVIFNEFDPFGGVEKAVQQVMRGMQAHRDKENFTLQYIDQAQKQKVTIPGSWLKKIEKGTLVIVPPQQKKEVFVPLHRISEVYYKGKLQWRL